MNSRVFELDRLASEPFVRRLVWEPELPSTNDRALALAVDLALPTPALVLTDTQTAGRGRGVNRWWSAPGALTFSVIVDLAPSVAPQQRPQASLHAALAVRAALAEFAPRTTLSVKWPNDVYLDGQKVCGILIESSAAAPGRLVIGIGVNVNNSFAEAPEPFARLATSLADQTRTLHNLTDVLGSILQHLHHELSECGESPARLIERWGSHCHLTGRTVQMDAAGRRTIGVCHGIDEDGALVLATPQGETRFRSGTIAGYD